MSSNTAMETGPLRVGFVRNTTPRFAKLSYSVWTSATPKLVAGMP